MQLIRGISGIRCIVNKTLTNSTITKHVTAFSQLQNDGAILLARDSRPHGTNFIRVASETLKKCGRKVMDYGIIPTPTAQFLIEKNSFSGGIVITASHNPKEWNGMKFIDKDGCFLDGLKNKALFKIADLNQTQSHKVGFIKKIENGYLPHIIHTINLSFIDTEKIKKQIV